ncbi:MAG: undecaprenyl/decaprenyl-phosphate alpha-N-acetylglucosaminyl 1-phosphate transferase [Endomicrobium sp.]|jgi:UDP-GlcNAc:undecaprenyl-phosphate GlcNAc-1-phosphate transferase|uniref:glycosyltransferase family 4 protein n=1 Tax=Candidatus Endomicrobiellum cubanum TaxID=3242325 RepID=UPI00282651F9|nr:undecaprenyl/decaprenyl-phosphate alpha-N-acetylglucosaminyl 1-phosphate transferase [Endomicrobium sp.]
MLNENLLYLYSFCTAILISVILTPICRLLAIKLNVLDIPNTSVKTHKINTPYLGGIAIASAWTLSLILIRVFTSFPTLTLRNLRGILIGAFMMLVIGFIDDIKKGGLGFKSKLIVQFLSAAIIVFLFNIKMNFIPVYWLSCLMSIVWIVGITNAFNIIDIMDGLSSGIAVIASFTFLLISLSSQLRYINFCSIVLAGALLGFIPYNLSKSKKIFMGDTGSLFIGFIIACVSLGTSYSSVSDIGLFAPIFVLAIPIYETVLVSVCRIKKGILPFVGSKDHYALRLSKIGFSKKQILVITYTACLVFAACAYLFTVLSMFSALLLFSMVGILMWIVSIILTAVKVD